MSVYEGKGSASSKYMNTLISQSRPCLYSLTGNPTHTPDHVAFQKEPRSRIQSAWFVTACHYGFMVLLRIIGGSMPHLYGS